MYIFYILALLPIIIGAILWYKDKEICWQEWAVASGAAFLIALIFNIIAICYVHSKTSDIEMWSGYVTEVQYHPPWVEQWEEMHTETYACGTDSKGNTQYCTRIYYTTEYDHHPEHWVAKRYFGAEEDSVYINLSIYNQIKEYFGNKIVSGGIQDFDHGGIFIKGDNKIYSTPNSTGFIYPATKEKSFVNRIKATPNIFQFTKVPTNINVYAWPESPDWNRSERLLGTASILIDTFKFDQLNAVLGPNKKVNLIIIGFGNKDETYAEYQQAKFIGGKKNDLVICFGGGTKTKPAQWAKCFGWSEKELVKRNIETTFISNPINNNLLPLLEKEIKLNYVKKDWHKFDYIKIQPSPWIYTWYFITIFLTQLGLWIYFQLNEFNKDNCENVDNYRSRFSRYRY